MLLRNPDYLALGKFINYPIFINGMEFSIQCSSEHICFPREDTFISDYETMEVGVFLNRLHPEVKNFITKNFNKSHFVMSTGGFCIYGNIDVEIINKMLSIASKYSMLN